MMSGVSAHAYGALGLPTIAMTAVPSTLPPNLMRGEAAAVV